MSIKRLLALELTLLMGLGSVFVLPRPTRLEPAGITLQLPDFVQDWYGRDAPVSSLERESLGPDTEFARKSYTNARGDEIFVSIVLSGPDMNTSIHRPERCLPAQGWTIADSRIVTLPTPLGSLRATRLHDLRRLTGSGGTPPLIYNLNYYWFVGARDTTPSHIERTFLDVRDRLLKGSNQRWAYVTVAAVVTKDLKPFGRSEADTDAMIQQLIAALVPILRA